MEGATAGQLRWGILSTARINRRVIPALIASPRSRLVGVASRSLGRARDFARRWTIPGWYGSYREILADSAIDAVYIPLPNHLHARWVVKAAEAGKHILCEKPLGLSPSEVDKMTRAAESSGVVLMEGFQFRFHPQMGVLRQLLRSGRLGGIQLVRGYFSFLMEDESNIRMRPETGGGALWDIGCYPVCFMQALLERAPQEVFAWQTVGPTGVDVAMAGQLRFSDGVFGQFDCSFQTPYRVGVEIVCRRGRIVLPEAWRAGISGSPEIHVMHGDEREVVEVPAADPFQCEIEALERAVLEGQQPAFTINHSRQLVQILSALYRSARLGSPVQLGEPGLAAERGS